MATVPLRRSPHRWRATIAEDPRATGVELIVAGLGPAGLDRVAPAVVDRLGEESRTVVVRTLRHPAAAELAARRRVVSCDDLYEAAADFEEVYTAISKRVLGHLSAGPVAYAVPGSAAVGERAVGLLVAAATAAGHGVEVVPGESFLDLVWARTGCDPIADGVQVLDGRNLPDPLQLHLPTVVTQVDRPGVVADVAVALGRTLPGDTPIVVLDALGDADENVDTVPLGELSRRATGARTSLYLDPPPNGWHGLVTVNRHLRKECPWDRRQTHHSLLPHLIEETYETVEAVGHLPEGAPGGEPDFGAYAELEEELGDLLLQVVFHATLAEEPGAFRIEEVAEGIRRKLVHRHPHVFGDVVAEDAETVTANWDRIKSVEKRRSSLMDDVPTALPALARAEKLQRRAASVGFDWDDPAPVLAKLREEIDELDVAVGDPYGEPSSVGDELGDVLFAAVNVARHLGIDPETVFRSANHRFATRFRRVEALAAEAGEDLSEMSLDEMDALWQRAKDDAAG